MSKTWKLISSPPDVVTTAILCAAARRTGGFSLSPLEERWLGVLSSFASDDEITQWGQIYMGNKETARFIDDKSILAVSVLQINNNKPDATKMLIKNAFAVMPELFTKPENTDVDISKFTNQDHSNNPKYTMAVVQSNTIVISFTNGSSIAHAFSFLINLAINEDDHVQNRNSIFGKAALVNFTKPHPPNETSFIFQREGKAGGFEVWIKFYPLAGPTGTLQTATLYSERLADPPQTVSG
ncbi:hypothetical protein ABEW05_003808 [Botrytis cinerea]